MDNNQPKTPLPTRGMLMTVLRPAHGTDCTNGGPSSRHEYIVLVGQGIPEIFNAEPDLTFVMDRKGDYKFIRPAEEGHWYMAGGNFAHSCDSRMRHFGVLPIHDRREW